MKVELSLQLLTVAQLPSSVQRSIRWGPLRRAIPQTGFTACYSVVREAHFKTGDSITYFYWGLLAGETFSCSRPFSPSPRAYISSSPNLCILPWITEEMVASLGASAPNSFQLLLPTSARWQLLQPIPPLLSPLK